VSVAGNVLLSSASTESVNYPAGVLRHPVCIFGKQLGREELGLNVIYGGHCAIEIFGVEALVAHLPKRSTSTSTFIDYPTEL
jgi:hypothetical protein